ncbi:DNA mobilization endonuclease VirD1/MobC family subunit [Rhizobium leguminosarum]|uniref:DNA mobilization endonuclease VirD1/MobC family subunit n=1 Tax=Rhizobium leguminosarum TaxID=384 RepID=UPI001C97A44D|nr:DNA mobilization endonuclease VirD1/MobC family subunit [Rhizobium leguminosarum]MBY5775227.1 DNA mobilization endonuclease VirD1/MobC family subunit [Rhizobium leguminosarum]
MKGDNEKYLTKFADEASTDSGEAEPKDYKIVSLRLRDAEYLAFSEQAAVLGLSHSMALRIAARRIGGFLEIDPDTRVALQDILRGIGDLSRSITELKAACEEAGTVDMDRFADQRAAFGREFARLDARISMILNVSRRRRDGRNILQEAANV